MAWSDLADQTVAAELLGNEEAMILLSNSCRGHDLWNDLPRAIQLLKIEEEIKPTWYEI